VCVSGATAQPDWVKNAGQSAESPVKEYLVGFGEAFGTDSEAARIAKEHASADISETIKAVLDSLIRTAGTEEKMKNSQHCTD
jgi:hypothetical protein